jgi:hypothetical protein
MVLEPPESVRKLQRALQTKAKGAPGYRFYLLYDKLYRKDVLEYAYDRCKANEGAQGVDGQDFADIETYGEESDGSTNWRTNSTRRRIALRQSDAYGFRRRTARSSAHSGSLGSLTAW